MAHQVQLLVQLNILMDYMMKSNTNTKFKLLVTPILLASSLLFLNGCGNAKASTDKEEKKEVSIPVEVANVSVGDISNTYSTTAILEAKHEAQVISKASGIIENIFVEEGDYVEKGQLLAEVETARIQLNVDRAKAEYMRVESELKRIEKVHGKSYVSADKYTQLKWQFKSAKTQLEIAQLDLKETKIVAPISGFIAERYVKVGNLAEQYQRKTMFHIISQSELQGIIHLPEQQLKNIKVNQVAELKLSATNSLVDAYIERVSPVINAETGTFKVTLRVPNEANILKAGMFSEVNIRYSTHLNTLRIPKKSIIEMDSKQSVYTVIDGVANRTLIETGFQQNGYVEITNGLTLNDQVVITGHNNLKDKAKVNVIESL